MGQPPLVLVPALLSFAWLGLLVLLCGLPTLAQSQKPPIFAAVEGELSGTPETGSSAGEQIPNQLSPGTISGTVVDRTGTAVAGAHVKLTRESPVSSQEAVAGEDGQFSFANVPPGPFQLTFTSAGFATQTFSGTLSSGQTFAMPPISLAVATAITEVHVGLSSIELAQEQLKDQEKQRVLGVIPNFYVTYVPNAVALTSKQKFQLAWKTTIDPVSFVITGGVAGIEQAQNHFSGYGQGAEGYAKRYGASRWCHFAVAPETGSPLFL